MQAGMESCLTKSIMAGGMGFALGGAFGLFMSSVCLLWPTFTCAGYILQDQTLRKRISLLSLQLCTMPISDMHLDVLRHTPHSTRASIVQSSRSRTASPRFQRHGLSLLIIRKKFRPYWGSLLWDGMLHRRLPGKIRLGKFCCCRLYNRGGACIQSWAAGCCTGLCWIRSFFRRHRLLHANAGRIILYIGSHGI